MAVKGNYKPEEIDHIKNTEKNKKNEDKNLKTNIQQCVGGDCGFDRCVFLRFRSNGPGKPIVGTNGPRRLANDGDPN